MSLLSFLTTNIRWLAAGAILAFVSSFGQTFFISIFAGHIQLQFDLSAGEWGRIYFVGTLASGLLMIWAGGLADRFRVRQLAVVFFLGLAVVGWLMAVNPYLWALPVIIFGLRFCGQGMISHIAVVAMARWYVANRGKAISISQLGYAVGEAFLPMLVVALLLWISWTTVWLLVGVAIVLILPVVLMLLRAERTPQSVAHRDDAAGMLGRHWTRAEVVRDWRFWALTPVTTASSIFGTALFFQQVHLAEVKGMTHLQLVSLFPIYTGISVVSGLLGGLAVDRFGATRIVALFVIPLAIAFVCLWLVDGWFGVALVFACYGVGQGIGQTATAAFWPQVYGARTIGAIKALATAFMVLGSAVGPALTGSFIDWGVSFPDQGLWIAGYLFLVSGLTWFVITRIEPDLRNVQSQSEA